MALIKCPECGQQISDKAASCIHCGCPVSSWRSDGEVKINTSGCGIGKVRILDKDENVLWAGIAGQIASFTVEKPIKINVCWGLRKHYKEYAAHEVKAGSKYAYQTDGLGLLSFVEVDAFNDSTI